MGFYCLCNKRNAMDPKIYSSFPCEDDGCFYFGVSFFERLRLRFLDLIVAATSSQPRSTSKHEHLHTSHALEHGKRMDPPPSLVSDSELYVCAQTYNRICTAYNGTWEHGNMGQPQGIPVYYIPCAIIIIQGRLLPLPTALSRLISFHLTPPHTYTPPHTPTHPHPPTLDITQLIFPFLATEYNNFLVI